MPKALFLEIVAVNDESTFQDEMHKGVIYLT